MGTDSNGKSQANRDSKKKIFTVFYAFCKAPGSLWQLPEVSQPDLDIIWK